MMRKTLLYVLLSLPFLLSAQVTNEGTPESWKWNSEKTIQSIQMPAFNLKALQDEDAIVDQLNDRPWRFGKEFIVNHHLGNAGDWTQSKNGDRVWRIRYQSKGAVSMNFLFEDFYLPQGAKIYLYNNDRTDLLGAYDHNQNSEERVLGTWLVDGDDVWIEYYEPAKVKNQGKLMIGKVVHGYRSQSQFAVEKGLNDSGNCNLDVDCPIGEFEDLKNHNKKGVGILLSGGSGFCSGSLINNTANDGTPYFLTANHCFSNPASWAFRFNWISPNPICASTANSTNGDMTQTISGAQLRARRAPSDFCLVEINNPIPAAWDIVWNGWNRTDDIPAKTWGVHHPSGDIMKVCVDENAPGRLTQNGNQPVWRIYDWDMGVTEGGSSGSPLFDPEGKIIGQLWRGSAACAGIIDNGGWDEYGRFAASWADGSTPAERLREWLDPSNSGITILNPFPPLEVFSNNAGIAVTNVPTVICNNTIEPVLIVRNFGTDTLVSADITYGIEGGNTTTIAWTGSLANGEQEEIVLNPITFTQNGTFTAVLENPNGLADEFPANNESNASFSTPPLFETTEVLFNLIPDNYGNETTWQFKNSSGAVLYSGGPYTNGNSTPINQTFVINGDDCYTFIINDSIGDGICCAYGVGSYTLTTGDGTVIVQGGDFGSSEETTFSNYNILSINNNLITSQISLYPNPSTGVVTISNATGNSLSYEVYNVLGQSVSKGNITGLNHTLNLSGSSAGLYFVKLTDAQTTQTTTKKLVIK